MEPTGPTFEAPRSPERAPEPPAPERPRRNLFEILGGRRKSAETAEPKPKAAERKAEKAIEAEPGKTAEPKRLGERLLAAVGIGRTTTEEAQEPAAPTTRVEARAVESDAVEPAEPEKPKAAIDRLVDSARKLGGNVLRIIGGARETVEAADAAEPAEERTDTRPLDKAERKVESALDELEDASEATNDAGGEIREETVEMPLSRLRAMQEAAAAAAYREVERQIEAQEERHKNALLQRQIGNLALGALLVAGVTAVYSWSKVRHLRKEQVAAEKREVKQQKALKESEVRIEELERDQHTHPMDRRERQEYVREVSHYASAQAEQIREVAADVREQQEERNFLHVPKELKLEVTVNTPNTPERKKTIVERAGELVGRRAGKTRDAIEGGVVGAGGVIDFISGKIIQPIKNTIQSQPNPKVQRVAHDPVQTWLNGVLLILGMLLLFAILFAIW